MEYEEANSNSGNGPGLLLVQIGAGLVGCREGFVDPFATGAEWALGKVTLRCFPGGRNLGV